MYKRRDNESMKLMLGLLLLALASSSMADGYRNPPMTAEALGKAGNAIVFTDDASAIEYNPANLAFQTNSSFVFSVTLAHAETTYNDGITGNSVKADDPWTPLPDVYFSSPLGDSGIAVGLGITTPYGQGSKYGRTELFHPAFRPAPVYEARLSLININPTVAFKINDKLAIGGGVDIYVSRLEFKQYFPWFLYGSAPDGVAEVDAYGHGFGGNVSATWNITEKQRLALTYRSGFKVDYDGDFEVSNFAPPPFPPFTGTTPKSDFSTEIEFPNIIGLGYGIELTDTVRVEADFEWQQWSSNESLKIDLDNNQPLLGGQDEIPNNWHNSIVAGIGGEWQFDKNWVARAGYRYLESPIPSSTTTPLLPDPDQHSFGFGLGYQNGPHAIDVAYVYSIYADVKPKSSENATYPGEYDIDSDLLGLSYSYSF